MYGMADLIEKRKRGRKPKQDKDQQHKPTASVSEPLILHLNINSNKSNSKNELFENNFCKYSPKIETPNAYNINDQFTSQPYEFNGISVVKENVSNTNVKNIMKNVSYGDKKNTDVICHWCCDSFENTIFGIPIKFKQTYFEVTGCFCSFECMSAFNFYSGENINNIWETYNLINLMAKKMQVKNNIYPAPPRKCLTKFGGYMDIDQFRNFNGSNKIINTHQYPLVAIVDQIEEINDYHHKNNDSIFLNFDKERLERFEKRIHQQSIDLIKDNYQNTIDSSMLNQ